MVEWLREPWLVVALAGAICLVCFSGIAYAMRREAAREGRLLQERQGKRQLQEQQLLLELDSALAQWLEVLQLPQFEDRTRREEAARQLSVLLIEKLMLRRSPGRPSKTGP